MAIKKLEDEIRDEFLDKKTTVIKWGTHDHDDKLEDYHRELISLMPWFGPHITKRINQGVALQRIRCTTRPVMVKGRYFLERMLDDRRKPHIGDVAT